MHARSQRRPAGGDRGRHADDAKAGDRESAESDLRGALFGRRVLELADAKGMYCGKMLADMGADVIKIERPGGDPTRRLPPLSKSAAPERGEQSLYFLYHNTSKRSVTLDLGHTEGRALYRLLAAGADLIVETTAVGYLESLGLGYAEHARWRPEIVLTSITEFGQTGPRCRARGSDFVAAALGGASYVTGDPADPPVTLAGWQSYAMASAYAAASSMIALLFASASGRGQHVDVSVQETTASVSHICGVGKYLDDGIVPKRFGTGLFASVPSGAYRCRDGMVYLMVNRPAHWKALAQWIHEVTGNQEVLDPMFEGPSSNRQAYRELLDLFITEMTERMTVEEVYRDGQDRHIAFTPVQSLGDVVRDPHLAARGYFVDVQQPGLGAVRMPGAPYHHRLTPWAVRRPAPQAGQHNEQVYCDELGLSREELARLRAGGIL